MCFSCPDASVEFYDITTNISSSVLIINGTYEGFSEVIESNHKLHLIASLKQQFNNVKDTNTMKVLGFILSLLTAADICVGEEIKTSADTFKIMAIDCDGEAMCLAHAYNIMSMKSCEPTTQFNTFRMTDHGGLVTSGHKDNKFKYYQANAFKGKIKMRPVPGGKHQTIDDVKYHKRKIWMNNPIHDTLIYAGNHNVNNNKKLFYPAATLNTCEVPNPVKLENYMQEESVQLNKFEIIYLPECLAKPDNDYYVKKDDTRYTCKDLLKLRKNQRVKACKHTSTDTNYPDAKSNCKLECKICF